MASPDQTASADPSNPPILFRKKRKAGIRQRAASPDDTTTTTAATPPTVPTPTTEPNDEAPARSNDDDAQETEQHIPSAIRHRARKRLNGVAFSTTARAPSDDRPATADTSSSRALVPATSPPSDEPLIAKRFAPQTGLATTIVNKHMMEYIESHLSNRASPSAEATSNTTPQPGGASSAAAAASTSAAAAAAPGKEKKVHPIMQGKLMEVDLGDEVRARNQAMTEKAARRLLGEAVPDEDEAGDGGRKAKKPRLGRDGKPWRPRNRRNSDDVKRDRLVEEILRENKLDVYDVPAVQQPQYEGDGDADDRIAEEFRREFMDAMVQRQQKKKAAAPPARAGARKADEDVLRGPKLGGSRNSRAAMRDLLLKKEKEGKK